MPLRELRQIASVGVHHVQMIVAVRGVPVAEVDSAGAKSATGSRAMPFVASKRVLTVAPGAPDSVATRHFQNTDAAAGTPVASKMTL